MYGGLLLKPHHLKEALRSRPAHAQEIMSKIELSEESIEYI